MIDPEDVRKLKAPLGIDPKAPTRFQQLLYAAVVEMADETLVEAAYTRVGMVRSVDAKRGAILVELGGADDDALAADLARFLARWPVRSVSFLVVGPQGPGEAFAKAAKPKMKGITIAGVDPDGRTWGDVPDGPLGEALEGRGGPADWQAFAERLAASDHAQEIRQGFAKRLQARPTRVTYAIVAVNVAFFLAQSWIGGSLDPSVQLLVQMGGVSRDLVAAGEPWRLVSSAFLHGGLLHLAFNMLVLVIIGRLIERILGPYRFLILYTACALAGAVASAAFMDAPVSVGASGALWGVLAAEAVLAFRPGFLPASLVAGARRAAVINLGLNVVNSFRPHVDWAAHFGGGVMGAALLWLVLSRGVPRGEALATDEPTPLPGMKVVAAICAVVLAVGALAGPLLGGALRYGDPPAFERVESSALGASLELPVDRGAEHVDRRATATEVQYGDLGSSRVMTIVTVYPSDDDERGHEAEVIDAAVSADIEGAALLGAAERLARGDRELRRVRYRLENDVTLDRIFFAEPGAVVRVDAYSLEPDRAGIVSERVAASWRPSAD